MKSFKTFIFEKQINKVDPEEIRLKYYSDLDQREFYDIIEADPTSHIDGNVYVGKYSKWLLKMFKDDNLELEDLYKVEEYIELFDKESVRNKLNIEQKNINNYNSLSDLAEVLEPFEKDKSILSKQELKKENLVASFENYDLYIPRSFEESCILGKGTEWCTATEKTDDYFRYYHKPGRELLIFINKKDKKKKYQLHLRTKQFMNKLDKKENLNDFLDNNSDIKDWLEKNYEKEFKKYFNHYYINIIDYKMLGSPKTIFGNFDCQYDKLKTLKGLPEIVEGKFNCGHNNLTTLDGGPKIVEGDFICEVNILTSLKGGPKIVEGSYNCSENNLTTLKGCPEKVEGYLACYNNQLITLEGCPKIIEGDFYCADNMIITLKWFPDLVERNFNCKGNNIPIEEIEELKKSGKVKGKIIY